MHTNRYYNNTRDSFRINTNDPAEVLYMQQQFPAITYTDIITAFNTRGPMRADVMKYLRSRASQLMRASNN